MNKHCHLVVPDLFLPKEVAAEVCAGLQLPALERLLARAQVEPLLTGTLEDWLCAAFGVADQAIAPVTLLADGVDPGAAYWLRADPVHLYIRQDQLVLQPDVVLSADEAAQLCASLNAHFASDGLRFFSPHPQRWYLQLEAVPGISTHPMAQAAGRDVRALIPQGADALRWHRVMNEIQMLLYEHPVNQAREARGELPVNSVWLWGGGYATRKLARPYAKVCGDSDLAAAFAQAAGIPCESLPEQVAEHGEGDELIVWEGLRRAFQHGDLGEWRDSLQRLERCVYPLLQALRQGQMGKITLDVLQERATRRFVVTRGTAWKFWRLSKRLEYYSAEPGIR